MNQRNSAPTAPEIKIPPELAARLRAAGIADLRAWGALTPHRKHQIFGIVPRMVKALDALARRA